MNDFFKDKKFLIVVCVIFILSVGLVLSVKFLMPVPEAKFLSDHAVEIVLSKAQYKVGEEIYFGILNKTDKELKIENECPREPLNIYKKMNDGGWKKISSEATVDCSGSGDIVIKAGELRGASFLPWQKILFSSSGVYKMEVELKGYENKYEQIFSIVP